MKKSSYIKKDSINSGISTNSAHSNNLNKKNQCLYKKEILSSLIRLPTKIKQDGVIKSYNIENIQREKKNYNTRPITVNLNKSINKQNIISPYKSNQDNNYNEYNNTSYSNQQKSKIDILINNLYDLFNQIQLLFLNGKNCLNECNDWIEIFNNNIEFIVEMCNSNEYLPLINNSLNLLFFTIIIIYDICNQNKFNLLNDDIKNIFEIYLILSENIFERCKNSDKINLQIQSNTISIANKDLNSFLNQLILNYHQINSNISRELTTLFKRLRRINTNDIYDFYQTKIKQYDLNYQNTNSQKFNNNNINNIQNYNYYNNYEKNYQNSNNEDSNISYMNTYNYKTTKYYSSNTSNSMPIPKNYSSKIINGPGNFLTTDINDIGAALTNCGVIFPFKKTSAMRQKDKNDRIRSISSNMNISTYSNDNNLDYFNQNNNNYIHNNNNFSNNTSPSFQNNNFDDFYNNNINIFESNNSNFNNYVNNNYNINNKYNQRNLNSYPNQSTIKYYDSNTKNSNKNNYNLNYNNFNNRNIGNININLNLIQQNKNYNNQRQNIININTPLIPFSPDKQFTLVLDLDETLSYVSKETKKIYLRPGLREFLQSLHPYYELIVFTSENKDYADQIIDFIEIEQKYFDYRLYKQNSIYYNKNYLKDIKKLGRDFKRTIIIDDKDENVELNNGIIIKSFYVNNNYHNLNDSVLYDLIGILIKIAKEEPNDIRNSLRRYRSEINKQIIK